jgi:RNA polymerase sigma factor (sigma-70 family)
MKTTINEIELIERYKAGDNNAFNALLNHFQKPLFSFILKLVKDQDLANDIFQETFIRFIRSINEYKNEGKLSSWLFSISHNLCKDYWRKKANQYHEDIDTDQVTNQLSDDTLDMLSQLENEQVKIWLNDAVEKLPSHLKEVLLLYIYSDMTFLEIANQLNCPLNTVLGRMHYAKQFLKEDWKKYGTEV